MLVFVIALMLLCLYLLKRFSAFKFIHPDQELIKILAVHHFSPREKLVVVDVMGKKLLLGATAHNITTLSQIEGDMKAVQGDRSVLTNMNAQDMDRSVLTNMNAQDMDSSVLTNMNAPDINAPDRDMDALNGDIPNMDVEDGTRTDFSKFFKHFRQGKIKREK
ncbi:MAG: flagellar biosynthetic protein FliO [Desulfamplus sp.]|nr:flagellar biosynthetic protein FliO [Desulfamplus sp.]